MVLPHCFIVTAISASSIANIVIIVIKVTSNLNIPTESAC